MELHLCVITDINPDTERVHLTVTGALTQASHQLLRRVVQQSRTLTDNTEVLMDLTTAGRTDNTAVDFLIWELDHHEAGALPPSEGHPAGPCRGTSRYRSGLGTSNRVDRPNPTLTNAATTGSAEPAAHHSGPAIEHDTT